MNESLIKVALGEEPADLILKNGKIIDVFTESTFTADVAIVNGKIAGVGSYDKAKEVYDATGKYIMPGFINAHCHVESSMASPEDYCREELRWGVTTLITDPHEIANIKGKEGILYMLYAGGQMPINYYVEIPSCVPATPFEHSGCIMQAKDMKELLTEPGVLGMGEMMNVPGVLGRDPEVMAKIEAFKSADRIIDGHAPCVTGNPLQAYISSGIDTDHESINWAEAKEKLRSGLSVLVREGSASRNLTAIIQGALAEKAATSRMAFCTDDKHLADIRKEGTIRTCIQMCRDYGMKLETAVAIATINAARIYGLKELGAVAPGYQADLVVIKDIEHLVPELVLHKGKDANKAASKITKVKASNELRGSVNIGAGVCEARFSPDYFKTGETYGVIEMLPGEIFTERGSIKGEDVPKALANGDICMIAVVERHHATGNVGLGLIRGYGLKNGAAATTVGHDSHNLLVVGSTAKDMWIAVQELVRCQGGYTLVQAGEVVATLPLDICGLMSSMPTERLCQELNDILFKAYNLGIKGNIDPFVTLSFMALPVIPKLRITDMGLFDAENFRFIQ